MDGRLVLTHARTAILALGALLAGGCNVILGIRDLPVGTGTGAGGSGGGGGAGGQGTTTITCDAGATACQGACVDLTSDPKNCGACGHDCFVGTCVASQCQAAVVLTSADAIYDIALDGDDAYVTQTSGEILSFSLAGLKSGEMATPVTLATGQAGALGIAFAQDFVHWTTYGGAVRSVSKDGGTPIDRAMTGMIMTGIGADSDHVYWLDGSGLRRAPASTSAAPEDLLALPPDQAVATSVLVAQGVVYWSTGGPTGGVYRVPLGSSTVEAITTGEDWPNDVKLHNGRVFWVDGGGAVMMSNGTPKKLADGGPNLGRVAVDATHVYWTSQDEGAVRRLKWGDPNPAATVETLATGESNVHGLAVDATRILWTRKGGVVLLAK